MLAILFRPQCAKENLSCLSYLSYNHIKAFLVANPAIHVQFFCCVFHDDVIKWKHFPLYWPFARGIHRSPVNSPHKGQWRGSLIFSLVCVWINGWVNNREDGDLRRYRAHYDVSVMCCCRLISELWRCWEMSWNAIDHLRWYRFRGENNYFISSNTSNQECYCRWPGKIIWWYICRHSGDHARVMYTGLILGLCPANEIRRYFVTESLIGWVQA